MVIVVMNECCWSRNTGWLWNDDASFWVSGWQFYEVLYLGQVRLSQPSSSFTRCQAQSSFMRC